MLKPNKHLNLQLSSINVSGLIIKILKDVQILTFDELLNNVKRGSNDDVKEMFLPALSFLFLLGKIQYHEGIDSFELKQ